MPEYITTAEASAILRVSPITVAHWRGRQYGPPAYRIGGSVRYIRDEVNAWAQAQQGLQRGQITTAGVDNASTSAKRKTGVAVHGQRPRVQRRHRLGGHKTKSR